MRDFPLLSSIEQYGTTSEGRPIRAFVVRRGSTLKPTVVIESGLRARFVYDFQTKIEILLFK